MILTELFATSWRVNTSSPFQCLKNGGFVCLNFFLIDWGIIYMQENVEILYIWFDEFGGKE